MKHLTKITKLLFLTTILSLTISVATTYAAGDCYWVGAADPNDEWDDPNNWSDDSATDVGYDGGATAAYILCHTHPGVWHLVFPCFGAQLLDGFHNLIDAGRSNRMTSSLEPSVGRNWDAAF